MRKRNRQSALYSIIMTALLASVAIAAWSRAKSIGNISYLQHIDDTAVTIDGAAYKFRDLAFYLAYQEMATQKQAEIYDFRHPDKYWNIHTNGAFIRLEAKDMAMKQKVHDVIFYQMALSDGIKLTPEETAYMENQKMDFWNDLEEEGRKRLGISMEELDDAFLQIALAQKKQRLLSDDNGADYRKYHADGELYQEILAEHAYQINESLWNRLNFGKITLD